MIITLGDEGWEEKAIIRPQYATLLPAEYREFVLDLAFGVGVVWFDIRFPPRAMKAFIEVRSVRVDSRGEKLQRPVLFAPREEELLKIDLRKLSTAPEHLQVTLCNMDDACPCEVFPGTDEIVSTLRLREQKG
jgi:hypothetical protein